MATRAHHRASTLNKFFTETDLRHHKLLENIVKILKINDLLEDYRFIVRNIQSTCVCKKTRFFLEHVNTLENKYKELIILDSHRENVSTNSNDLVVGHMSSNYNNNTNSVHNTRTICAKSMTSANTANHSSSNNNSTLNFSFFNSSLSNDGGGGSDSVKDNFKNNRFASAHIKVENDLSSSSFTDHHHSQHPNTNSVNNGSDPSYTGEDDVNLIEEEDIMEDEEDDAEEELDIEEYMALSEILEKESSQNKFEKEEDPKNDFILAIREMSTKEIICYECTVGGTCGFLSRERARMLLHISKHFQDHDERAAVNKIHAQSSAGNDIDISIIPVNADSTTVGTGGPTNSTSGISGLAGLSGANHSVDCVSLLKEELKKSHNNGNSNPTVVAAANNLVLSMQAVCQPTHHILTTGSKIKNNSTPSGTKLVDKPIHCKWDNCSFQCDQNYKLRTHIRQVHEKVRPYLCDWPGCFGAYKTRSNLASHRMVHTGERPYICDYPKCGAKFARKYDCERHRRIHSEKMFACDWPGCGKRLCDPYNLERHMMVHKGELPFRCPIGNCIRGFRELRYLRDHMVNSHKFLPDTNQLRLACMNSSKMFSISGYNLNDNSNSECSTNEVVAAAFVNAIQGANQRNSHNNNNNNTNSTNNDSNTGANMLDRGDDSGGGVIVPTKLCSTLFNHNTIEHKTNDDSEEIQIKLLNTTNSGGQQRTTASGKNKRKIIVAEQLVVEQEDNDDVSGDGRGGGGDDEDDVVEEVDDDGDDDDAEDDDDDDDDTNNCNEDHNNYNHNNNNNNNNNDDDETEEDENSNIDSNNNRNTNNNDDDDITIIDYGGLTQPNNPTTTTSNTTITITPATTVTSTTVSRSSIKRNSRRLCKRLRAK